MNDPLNRHNFEAMSWTDLDKYVAALKADGAIAPSRSVVAELLEEFEDFDPIHKMYLIEWSIALGVPGAEDHAVCFYEREDDEGAQYTVLMWLEHARYLTSQHIERLARAPTRIRPEDVVTMLGRLRDNVST